MTTVQQKIKKIQINKPEEIPWLIRFLENPQSPCALPGKISLYNHDCLHVLLDRETSLEDEAFVVGFCMGNDPKTNFFHLWIFKFVSQYLYPQPYRFRSQDFFFFKLGFKYGKILKTQFNLIDFAKHTDIPLSILRQKLGINDRHLHWLKEYEKAYLKCKELGINL